MLLPFFLYLFHVLHLFAIEQIRPFPLHCQTLIVLLLHHTSIQRLLVRLILPLLREKQLLLGVLIPSALLVEFAKLWNLKSLVPLQILLKRTLLLQLRLVRNEEGRVVE